MKLQNYAKIGMLFLEQILFSSNITALKKGFSINNKSFKFSLEYRLAIIIFIFAPAKN
jgi:hypothetical protein